ncbi:MAG: hypothetical protein ACKO37_00100 [Vampirovibrionales bacterium]
MMNMLSPMGSPMGAMGMNTLGNNGMSPMASMGASAGANSAGASGGPMPPGSIPFASAMLPQSGVPQFSPQAQLQAPMPPQGSLFQVNGQSISVPPGGSATIQSGGMTITLQTNQPPTVNQPLPVQPSMPMPPQGMPVGMGMNQPPMMMPPQLNPQLQAQAQQLQQAQQQQQLMGLVLQSLIHARTGLASTQRPETQPASQAMEAIIRQLAAQRMADMPPRATGTPNIAARGLPLPQTPQGDGRTPMAAIATGGDPLSPLKSYRNNPFGIPVGYDNIGPQIGALPAAITAFMQMLQNTSMLGTPSSYQTV